MGSTCVCDLNSLKLRSINLSLNSDLHILWKGIMIFDISTDDIEAEIACR